MGDSLWEALRRQVFMEESVCHICLELVDFSAPPRTRWAPSVDHVKSKVDYPHLAYERSNLRLAHVGCNSRKNARGNQDEYEPSREW